MPRRYLGSFVTYNPVEPTASAASGMWPLNQQLQEVAAGTWPLPFGDPYFNYTTLLLSSTSLSNANNNLFVDSSGAFNPISRTGNTTQGSFAPYGTYWSNYSDNSGDYLTAGSGSSAFAFGTGNFTIEGWFYSNASVANWKPMLSVGAAASGQLIRINQGLQFTGNWGMLYPNDAGNADVYFDTGSPFPLNQWVHVALVRNGTTLTLYQNGVNVLQKTVGFNFTNTTGVAIGYGQYPADGVFGGYMSNIRIVKGTAVYTANFTPPTTPLTAISGTSLLTCQSNRFRDASSNNFAVTPAGDIRVTDFSPFLHTSAIQYNQSDITNWSGYFDGSGDWLSAPSNTAFAFGTGDFTTEAWVYRPATGDATIISPSGGPAMIFYNVSQLRVLDTNTANALLTDPDAFPLNQWVHVACTRASGTMRLFVNGALKASGSVTNNFTSTGPTYIGLWSDGTNFPWTGYISNARIVKGTAVYTSAFTPPTSPLTAISGTSLLTCQNAAFTDNSTNNFILTQNGNVTVTGNSPFNTVGYWSNYFDGGANSLSATSANFAFGTGAWTVEFWIYPLAYGGSVCGGQLFGTTNGSTSGYSINLGQDINSFRLISNATGSWADNLSVGTGNGPSLNTWTHMAVVRSGANISIYKNGTRVATTASATSWNFSGTTGVIGRFSDGSNVRDLNAYLSNLRVANTAIYDPTQSTITVPTAPPTAVSGTQLLTCQNGRFIDNSTNALTITRTGTVSTQSFDPFYTSTIASSGGSMYFDGSADYIEPSWSSTSLPGSWTFECWFYATAASGMIFDCRPNSTNGYYPNVSIASSTQIDFYYNANSNFITVPGGTINKWIHLAVVKNGTSLVVYLDGVSSFSATDSNTWAIGASRPRIGANGGYYSAAPAPLTGYISNFRILNGTAAYTGAFTPPTAPTSPTPNTILMLNGMNAGAFDATATNDFETVGNAQVRFPSPFAPANYWGGSFDGSGDYLSVPTNSAFNLSNGDFTLECWVYNNSISGDTGYMGIWDTGYILYRESSTYKFYYYGPGFSNITASVAAVTGAWTHLAVVRNGATMTFYINGTSAGTASIGTTSIGFPSHPFILGANWNNGSPASFLNGSISNARLVKGTAVYTSNFTPPTAPLTAISGTSLLTCQNKTFIDNSANAFTITANGNATAGAIGPFTATGGTSVYVDGSGDYLKAPDVPQFYFGTANFTIEAWVNFAASVSGADYPIIAQAANTFTSNASFAFTRHSSNKLRFIFTDDGTGGSGYKIVDSTNNFLPSAGVWYHLAVTRSGSTFRLFVDGVQVGSNTYSQAIFNGTRPITIGADDGATVALNGYISDLRVTNGYARYTANFTPPTAALPTY